MSRSLIRRAVLAGLFCAGLAGFAMAQVYTAAPQPYVNPNDLIPATPTGNASAPATYINPVQISGTPGYTKAVPVTGFSLTFNKAQTWMLLYPTGTLAAGGVVTEANPSDGERECVRSSQAVTTFTWAPNVAAQQAQTINNGPTTLAANTSTCLTYSKANATWDPS